MQKGILVSLVMLIVAIVGVNVGAQQPATTVEDIKALMTPIKGGAYYLPPNNLNLVIHTYEPLMHVKNYTFGISSLKPIPNAGMDQNKLTEKSHDLYQRLSKVGQCDGEINEVFIDYRRVTVTTFVLSDRQATADCVVKIFEKAMK